MVDVAVDDDGDQENPVQDPALEEEGEQGERNHVVEPARAQVHVGAVQAEHGQVVNQLVAHPRQRNPAGPRQQHPDLVREQQQPQQHNAARDLLTEKGKRKLEIDGYCYNFQKKSKKDESLTFWHCERVRCRLNRYRTPC